MDIVFEPLVSSPETLGTQIAELPGLASIGSEQPNTGVGELRLSSSGQGSVTAAVDGTGLGELPALLSLGAQAAGGMGVGFLPELLGSGFQSAGLVPQDGDGTGDLPAIESAGTGVLAIIGAGDGELQALTALGLEAAGGYGIAELAALTGAGLQQAPSYTAFVSAAMPRMIAGITATNDMHCIAAATYAASQQLAHAIPVSDGFAVKASMLQTVRMTVAAIDPVVFESIATIVQQVVATEAFALDAPVLEHARSFEIAAETVLLLGLASSKAAAIEAVAAAVVIDALALRGWQFEEAEGVVMDDAVQDILRRIEALVESIELTDTSEEHARMTLLLEEGVVLDAEVTDKARLYELLTESVLVVARFNILGEPYVAWAINAEGGNPASRYDNFGFTSFAAYEIGGRVRYFGTMPDGLYELAGDDDAGAPIDLVVRGALSNFGSSAIKGMPVVYFGLSTSGEVVYKAIVTNPDSGQREAHWYKPEGRPSPALREDRVKPDKGIESVYWNWELVNIDGADVTMDAMGFVPMYTSRRV